MIGYLVILTKENQMLLKENNLTKSSTVKVDLKCDYCGRIYQQEWRNRVKGFKIIKKDACKNCRILKRKESCLKTYGVDIASKSPAIRKKASKTKGGSGYSITEYKEQILSLYKEDMSVNRIAEILQVSRTVLSEYMRSLGLDTGKNAEKKRLKTMNEKYGVDYYLQCEKGKNNLKTTFKNKYGSENPYENPEYKKQWENKYKTTCLKKYGAESVLLNEDRREEFKQKRKATRLKNGQIIYRGMDVNSLSDKLNIAASTLYERIQKWGLDVSVAKPKNKSYLELLFEDYFTKNNIKFNTQVKIGNCIADFVLGNNIVIECDGLYWHSEERKSKSYHKNKRDNYIENGFVPLFFREDELRDKFNIVSSIVNNKINNTTKVYARKLSVKSISNKVAKQFFSANHLMGAGRGYTLALVDNDNILCAIRLCKKNGDLYEISRFCSKLNYSVIGGFSRLLNHAEKILNSKNIITFIDYRYGQGDYLTSLGFQLERIQVSFKWTDLTNTYHRMKFPGNQGYEIGLTRIYDCGQAKFVK